MRPATIHALGIGLFLFIPLVLFLFVRHPAPIGVSLTIGVVLMLGHRFLARPYLERVRGVRCIWCARVLAEDDPRRAVLARASDRNVEFVACAPHADPAHRFFAWLDRLRLPLRLGIGAPLVALLTTLALVAASRPAPLAEAVETFRFVVGITVEIAALGALLGRLGGVPAAAFPLHNFSLLGIRNLLWIFRLVGLWWIAAGGSALWRLAAG